MTGFRCFTQDGTGLAQVDSLYRNLHFKRKGSAVTNNTYFTVTGGNVTYVEVNIGTFNRRPLVAVNCTQLCAIGRTVQQANSSWVVTFYVRGELGSSLNWYTFDTLANNEKSSFGLIVYDESGNVIFDAMKFPMRVSSPIFVSGSAGGQTIQLLNSRVYAVSVSLGGQVRPAGTGASVFLLNGSSVQSNGQITTSPFQAASISGSSTTQNHPSYGLVLDVTGY